MRGDSDSFFIDFSAKKTYKLIDHDSNALVYRILASWTFTQQLSIRKASAFWKFYCSGFIIVTLCYSGYNMQKNSQREQNLGLDSKGRKITVFIC